MLLTDASLAFHLAVLHLLPHVTLAVLMGAAAGHLLIGHPGSFLLQTLLLWQPQARPWCRGLSSRSPPRAPVWLVRAISWPHRLSGDHVAGQLYLAVMITLILGRFHRRPVP